MTQNLSVQNSVQFGDCLELMKMIPDESVDMVCADLPYGRTKNKWDSLIPLPELWTEYNRVIKAEGAIVLFSQNPFDKILGGSNLKMLKYEWIWNKKRPTGYMNANYAPLKQHENILVFSKKSACYVKNKESAMNYYPQGLKPINKVIKRSPQNGNYDNAHYDLQSVQKFTGYPKSILEFNVETGLHPTQKPVKLLEYLIKTYTNEGELVLDNTAGSMTTGIACINTNRNCTLMEKDAEIYQTGLNRIKEHLNRLDRDESGWAFSFL